MPHENRCHNCCFSTFALGPRRAVLICRSLKGSEGRWAVRRLDGVCPNFYPSRAASPNSRTPRCIPLTRGRFALVDADDYPALARYEWFAEGSGRHLYAVRKHKGKSVKMHRQILDAPPNLLVDHIDHDGLNNRRANLRLATFTQNCRNQKKSAKATSRYKGVYWHKHQKKWTAQITAAGKSRHLGYFTNETDAARAYDTAAKKLHKAFAALNFPE